MTGYKQYLNGVRVLTPEEAQREKTTQIALEEWQSFLRNESFNAGEFKGETPEQFLARVRKGRAS